MSQHPTSDRSTLAASQLGLLPLQATATFTANNGKHQAFYVYDENRSPVWCKSDSAHRPIRATEWICSLIAEALGIRTAGHLEVHYDGSSYFGSPHIESSSRKFAINAFLRSSDRNTYGGSTFNRGKYLSGLIALDMFLSNPDRHLNNFILSDDNSFYRLCAIDYGDADLMELTTQRFPVAGSSTVELGRAVKAIHGGFVEGALDMLDRIGALAPDAFHRIVASVPADWLHTNLKDRLNDAWGSSGFRDRLASLRAGIESGQLV